MNRIRFGVEAVVCSDPDRVADNLHIVEAGFFKDAQRTLAEKLIEIAFRLRIDVSRACVGRFGIGRLFLFWATRGWFLHAKMLLEKRFKRRTSTDLFVESDVFAT